MSSGRLAVLAASLLVAGCGTSAGGDPGGRRLHELGSDRVFASFPAGTTMIRVTRTPAHYAEPGFTGGGWRGPAIVVSFRSSAPPADVYGFYERRAGAAGWQAVPGTGAHGVTDRWRKTYPDAAAATLLLAASGGDRYELDGGVAPRLP